MIDLMLKLERNASFELTKRQTGDALAASVWFVKVYANFAKVC